MDDTWQEWRVEFDEWIDAGRLLRSRTYVSPAEALEAAGLSEQDAHVDS
jgi:hypothetical protein